MSIEEKRRATFEEFYRRYHIACGLDLKFGSGRYLNYEVHEAWRLWNAALDSVVIELPYLSRGEYANQHSFNCAAESMGYARQAIESAGLKVKP